MILNGSVTNSVRAPVRRDVFSSRLAALWLGAVLMGGIASPSLAGKLPLERLFTAPDVSGPTLRGVKVSPNGKLIAYLRARADDKDRFDLWAYDVIAKRDRL